MSLNSDDARNTDMDRVQVMDQPHFSTMFESADTGQ